MAQRGLDIKAVDWVVNFDCPKTVEDYIHRIGRTGRAGAKGSAMTFVAQESDSAMMRDIAKVIKDVGQPVPPELDVSAGGRAGGSLRKFVSSRSNRR